MSKIDPRLRNGPDREGLMRILNEAPVKEEPDTPSTDVGEKAVEDAKGDIVFQGDFYALLEDHMGHFILIRLADGASAYFKGDDSDQIEKDYKALDDKFDDDYEFTKQFDSWASGYDDVLEVPNGEETD